MSIEIITIPCREDNYAYLIHDTQTGQAALIDIPDAAPINAALTERGATLTTVLITHHHYDHVDGLDDLHRAPDVDIIGAAADQSRLPSLDKAVAEGDQLTICGTPCQVIDVPGHTIGHIAYYFPEIGALFTADSLMTMGCGRLFEGSPDQMWKSLCKLRALPADTRVFTGHEYTQTNIAFALSIDPSNAALQTRAKEVETARQAGRPTTGASLATETATNPFLRADAPAMAAALGMEGASATEIFAHIRTKRDNWR